ncbi:MAG: hypothetical protein ACRC3H_13505 [Lachnospiraceae bacterium]
MIRTLIASIKLSQTYGINTVIYWLRQLPLIKHLFSVKLYGDSDFKMVIRIFINLYRIVKTLLGKIAYVGVMIYLPLMVWNRQEPENFLTLLFWFSLAGAVMNTYLFCPTKEKYYAIILMRMDGRRFAQSNYLWFLIQTMVSLLPVILVFGLLMDVILPVLLLIPLFIAAAKVIGTFCRLKLYQITGKAIVETNLRVYFSAAAAGLLLGYGLVYLDVRIPLSFYIGAMLIMIGLAVYPAIYLWNSRLYGRLFKEILNPNDIIFKVTGRSTAIQKDTYRKNISAGKADTGDKSGYEYFNTIFVSRHHKLLTRSIKYQSVGCLIVAAAAVGACIWNQAKIGAEVNQRIMVYLPYMVFIMYILNRSSTMTQAMFMNCDHSMLAYRFYRQKETIIGLFKLRLNTLVKLNLIPALIIGCGLMLLVFVTGGVEQPLAYVLILVSIAAMSVFFSVHHLTLYYLLQPYNVNIESKSKAYSIANGVTYLVCYVFLQLEAPFFLFSILAIVFSVIYIAAALILVYKYAPKRFKLK